MKSILVDALRQANGDDKDQALSDSGSFDASQDTLAPPANDVIDGQDSELELMSTTNGLVVAEELEQEAEENQSVGEPDEMVLETEADFDTVAYEPVDDEHAMTVAGMMPLPVTRRQAPRLARLAPLLCAALAIIVAVSWLLINRLGVPNASLGTTVTQANNVQAADEAEIDPVTLTRFRFLDGDEESAVGGSTQ